MRRIYFDAGGYRNAICFVDPTKPHVRLEKINSNRQIGSTTREFYGLYNVLSYVYSDLKDIKEIEIIGDAKAVIEYARRAQGKAWIIPKFQIDYIKNYCHDLINELSIRHSLEFKWVNRRNNLAGEVLTAMRHFDKDLIRLQ
jgi:hypothetical protein